MRKNSYILPLMVLTLSVAFFSLGLGKYPLSPYKIMQVLMAGPFYGDNLTISAVEHQVIWQIRLPRILTALCAGGGLALAGAALQGVFHNPLVDPHIIGVTSGSAFGGTLAILLGFSPLLLMLSAFIFGLAALMLVYAVASLLKQRNNLILVLAGVVMSGFFSALVSMLQYMADTEEKLPSIVFWLMGSFATSFWHKFAMFFIPFASAAAVLLKLRWRINVLSLGDKDARALGMNAGAVRWLILVLCAVIVAAQVSVSGSIGWVGLVIPHLARLFAGVDHRRLLPASLWLGGCFMIVVDDMARMLTSSEVPLGIITAILGAPLFTVLLVRNIGRRELNA